MGNPLGNLHFGNTDGVVYHFYTRHVPTGSNLAEEGARSLVLTTAGIPQAAVLLAGDVPENMECDVELV